MANLLSELERFEEEIKVLGSELHGRAPPRIGPPLPPQAAPRAVLSSPALTNGSREAIVGPALPPPRAFMRPLAPPPAPSQFTFVVPTPPTPQLAAPPTFYPHLQQIPQFPQYPLPQVQAPQYHYSGGIYQTPPDVYNHPQQQQAHVLFQKDAQTITPEALENVKAALASGDNEQKSEAKKRAVPRKAAGTTWEDASLADWPENDFRLFCGDLGNEVNDEVLTKAFTRFATFNMAKVVRDKRTGKTKGYGFVSFSTPADLALAMKEMNGKYVGNRPIKLRKSTWKERIDYEAAGKQKNFKRPKLVKKNVLHK